MTVITVISFPDVTNQFVNSIKLGRQQKHILEVKGMVVEPKVKGFMCTTAHPEGCKAAVKAQIDYVKSQPKSEGPKKVLVIGSSMGYGLASRIAVT